MLRIVDLTRETTGDLRRAVPRADFDVNAAMAAIIPVCTAVKDRGAEALREYSEKFDHVVPDHLRVPAEALVEAAANLDDTLRQAFTESIRRRRQVCREVEVETSPAPVEVAAGARVSQRIVPVGRVGLYVPGGFAPLASSVIMNVVPAQEAGVASIAVASPPQAEFGGLPHPNILALCHLLGVDEVYAVGGAQAIAMFAHGVEGSDEADSCPRVDMVTGPGNIYVVAAKRYLRGTVGIDSEAGPTEIAILADKTADPRHVAADLMSQAEHDTLAAAVLVTDSTELADAVEKELAPMVEATLHSERIRTSLTSEQSAIVMVRDIDQGLEVVNAYAAEHLEIQTADAAAVAARVHNAGAIFVGPWSPVSLGDYSAGSTHVLPTAGAACHSSGLSVRSFMRAVHVIDYTEDALLDLADSVENFALAENLPGHANAITVRRPR
ncbi:MAG: histidinol dehydrogenase [Cutibacterium avidum]|uniref:Histidinol dehydrogenase n=1 Tax=Cutibacterium avidum TaxID=33010 RepID=A0A3E2DHE5_9ACTN|nr:histidinol dehydrogenase [Cutibacterium avidum]MBS5744086.1 histidinol dehydrogenase [Propionibacterium sp.]MDK7358163.1 histidinol dehydrogenase [Cutibacterium avidum]MDK7372962.1 histidinol dehydrogenase [Cutibacterium avidum]MDU2071445.1 histidinol dehydrogenase [Cutibacterium avidum]MDU3218463.1 histidinol dehydrogenase [Cutibacterium avidum]